MFDTAETLEQADVVLVIFTSNYLLNYLCGFNQSALELYENGVTKEQAAIFSIMESIKNDPQWYTSIQQQAQERGISTEECLIKNAAYVYEMQKIEQEKQP